MRGTKMFGFSGGFWVSEQKIPISYNAHHIIILGSFGSGQKIYSRSTTFNFTKFLTPFSRIFHDKNLKLLVLSVDVLPMIGTIRTEVFSEAIFTSPTLETVLDFLLEWKSFVRLFDELEK